MSALSPAGVAGDGDTWTVWRRRKGGEEFTVVLSTYRDRAWRHFKDALATLEPGCAVKITNPEGRDMAAACEP